MDDCHFSYIIKLKNKTLIMVDMPPPNTRLSPNTLADLSQFFSILIDLKCYESTFLNSSNHLWNAKPKSSKENKLFLRIAKCIFVHFLFILTSPASSVHNFLIFFLFKLSDLNFSKITILSSANHLVTLMTTE
jgi:hypothetical protein